MPYTSPERRPHIRGAARAALLAPAALALGGCGRAGALSPRGTGAAVSSQLWWYMLWLGGGITVGFLLLFFVAMFRRHRADRSDADDARLHRRFVIGGGLVLPGVALGSLFVYGIITIDDYPDGGDVVIEATGYQFWWEFTYDDPEFVTANEMYIPVDTDVRVRLRAADVIHSFWVPQISGKRDMVPGKVNELTIHATEPGRYFGECAEYCGIQHANMQFSVVAVPPEEYRAWLDHMAEPAAEPDTEAELAGYETFMSSSCVGCHAIRGTPADGQAGPALTHFALREKLGAGVAPNDRGHLGGWVVNAQALKPGNEMPPVEVDAEDLPALLTYLESLE